MITMSLSMAMPVALLPVMGSVCLGLELVSATKLTGCAIRNNTAGVISLVLGA